jgi:carbon catabolite-derepressing protein kinase
MASALDDEDLSLSLPVFDRETPHQNQPALPIPAGVADTIGSDQSPSQVRTSQRLGQYKVERTLGEGSFGKVKLATHEVSGQQVALKIITRRKLVSRDMAGRVEREIQYLQLLRHPHIIKL